MSFLKSSSNLVAVVVAVVDDVAFVAVVAIVVGVVVLFFVGRFLTARSSFKAKWLND